MSSRGWSPCPVIEKAPWIAGNSTHSPFRDKGKRKPTRPAGGSEFRSTSEHATTEKLATVVSTNWLHRKRETSDLARSR